MVSLECTYVVPCYNESSRLDVRAWVSLAASGCRLLFVDDGFDRRHVRCP